MNYAGVRCCEPSSRPRVSTLALRPSDHYQYRRVNTYIMGTSLNERNHIEACCLAD